MLRAAALIALLVTLPAAAHPPMLPHLTTASPSIMHAKGTFDVTVLPEQQSGPPADAGIQRLSIDKRFHGDLDGTSKGEMIAYATEETKSGVYVALERVTATLGGKQGTFALMHAGTRNATTQNLSVKVVPESGTGGLAGIDGTMTISIENKAHYYTFDYTLPDAR